MMEGNPIDQFVRDQVRGAKFAPDPGSWGRIQAQVKAARRRRLRRWGYGLGLLLLCLSGPAIWATWHSWGAEPVHPLRQAIPTPIFPPIAVGEAGMAETAAVSLAPTAAPAVAAVATASTGEAQAALSRKAAPSEPAAPATHRPIGSIDSLGALVDTPRVMLPPKGSEQAAAPAWFEPAGLELRLGLIPQRPTAPLFRGVSVQAQTRWQLRPRWSLQPGVGLHLFTEPGPRSFDTTFTAQTNAVVETRLKQRLYLEAPVTLHYHFHRRLSAYAGVSLGYLLTTYAAEQTRAYQGGNIEETNREVFGRRTYAQAWQVGGLAGLQWQLTPRWAVDLRYSLGNRPGQTQGPGGELQALPRQQYLQVGFGYQLFRLERIRAR